MVYSRLLLQQCNWLSIKQLIVFHTAVQVWKVKQCSVPSSINSMLTHMHTRSGKEGTLAIPWMNSVLGGKSFLVRGPVTWNMIPVDIRNHKSIKQFKSKLRAWIMHNVDLEWHTLLISFIFSYPNRWLPWGLEGRLSSIIFGTIRRKIIFYF